MLVLKEKEGVKMKKQSVKKAILITVGALLLLNAVFMAIYSNLNAGILVTFLLGAVLVLYAVFINTLVQKMPKILRNAFWICVGVVVGFSGCLLSTGLNDTVTYNEDAIIVLGSGIRGEMLTVGLKNRLDSAIAYYEKNEDALIVVSGGQGPQESITEALAMERYLLSRGIPAEKIIKEEKATSTFENFMYSKEILDEMFEGEYTVCFVSNEYHIYRASSLAKISGFESTTHTHSSTVWYTVIPSTLRECMAVVKMWVFKN